MAEVYLPLAWQNCSLGDLLTGIQTGKSVRCDERPPQFQEKGLIKISAVTWGEFNENESKTLLSSDHLQSSHKIDIGDLLISRANTLELVGACVMVKNLSKNLYLSDKVLRLEIDELLKPLMLRYLNSKDARTQIESLATGNQLSMRNISQDAIRAIRLPLPPLAEQKVITDKLDTLLAQVGNTKARLKRIPEILKSFRQSVLAAAVSGKLTEDWRGGAAFWEDEVSFGSLIYESSVGLVRASSEQYEDSVGRHQYVKMNNIDNFWGYNNDNLKYVDASKEEVTKYRLEKGDWLFNTRNSIELVGKSCVWRGEEGLLYNNNILRVRFNNTVLADYIEIFVKSPKGQRLLATIKSGTTNVAAIYQKQLFQLSIHITDLEEQTEIVRRVEELFAFADRIEQAAQAAQSRVNHLTQSILAKAFRGELTADWRAANPNLISGDNSAAALLAKIKAERTKLSKKAKAKA